MKSATILLAVMAWAGTANAGGVLYETGFETVDGFSEGTSIDGIDGWYMQGDPQYGDWVTQSAGSINGTMSMHGAKVDRNCGLQHFTNTTEKIVAFTAKAKLATTGEGPDGPSNHLYFWVYGEPFNAAGWGKRAATVFFSKDGKIWAYGTGYALEVLKNPDGTDMTYNANQVYGVRMVTDFDTQTYDIYIDSGSGYALVREAMGYSDTGATYIAGCSIDSYNVSSTVDDMSFVGIDPGDANFNGTVDDSDLNILLTGWYSGATPGTTWPEGDFNKDGVVNDSDLNLLLSNWDYPPAGSVPEPATIGLLAFGAIALVRRRRRA